MAKLEQKITLQDSCNLISKSKDIFAPIKEAMRNSFDSIIERQRQKTKDVFTPTISVSVNFNTTNNLFGERIHSLDYITIEDNGIGFTSENLSRFKKLASDTKGLNNKGTGKIQIFCRFDKISIDSIFCEKGKWNKLNAIWILTGEYSGKTVDIENQNDTKTILKMSGFNSDAKEGDFFIRYLNNINEFKRDILKHFLLRLWLGNKEKQLNLTIRTLVNDVQKDEYTFEYNNIPSPDKEESIEINTEQANFVDKKYGGKFKIEWMSVEPKYELTIHRFKISSEDMDENAVYLCSRDIMVEKFEFPAIKRKDAVYNGYRYLSSINGDIFDQSEYVSHAVDKFNFQSKKDTEAKLKDGYFMHNQEHKFIFWDEIEIKINEGLARVYDDVDELKEKRKEEIAELARQYGISMEDAEAAPIAQNDSTEVMTKKLFETQAKRFAEESMEIQNTYQELKDLGTKDLDPTSDQYRTKFEELSIRLLKKIPQQNKDELARYIIRRDMVVDLLKLALNNSLAVQKEWEEKKDQGEKVRQDNEGLIHDIIFRRHMKGVPNDLWILNEEFIHFDGCSDLELDKLEINGERVLKENVDIYATLKDLGIQKETYLRQRPDIFLYPEEGKCILIELKAPDIDVSAYCDQIQRYARLIANFSRKPFIQFFGLLIGETIDKANIPGRYEKVPYGNYWFNPYEPIKAFDESETVKASLYQEIIPLSEIAKRAEIRNRSFAEKLGITQNDLKKIQNNIENHR